MKKQSIALLAFTAGAVLIARPLGAQTLVADYQLQNTYNSSVGSIGPLTVVGDPADAGFNSGVDVDGNTQTVVNITQQSGTDTGAGLQAQTMSSSATYLDPANYSVVLLADFNLSPDLLATKVFDFKNLSSDAGVYINDTTDLLEFNDGTGVPLATGATAALTGTYTQIVLTRNSATNLVSVYQDGTPDFSFTDSSDLAVLGDATSPSSNAYLTVFKDDDADLTGTLVNETSVGDVARLRLYDGVLSPAQVAALDTAIPEPASLSLLVMGVTAITTRRRRRHA